MDVIAVKLPAKMEGTIALAVEKQAKMNLTTGQAFPVDTVEIVDLLRVS